MAAETERDIGRVAVERGLITQTQLDASLAEIGPTHPIGDILVERGLLTRAQLERLVRAVARPPTGPLAATSAWECASCMLRYDLVGADPARRYRCKKCDGLLSPRERPAGQRADETVKGPRLEVPVDVPSDAAQAAQDPKNRFGKYVLICALGRGGMGTVYKAYDPELHRTVALKVLTVEHGDAVERFRREAQTVARLKHPHIVSIYEIGRHEKAQYLAMEFVEGPTLDRLKKTPSRRAADILRDVAGAVQYAHDRGIIHRDLKPANIIIDAEGRPYVTDFGLAREIRRGHSITAEGFTVGTPSYMSPEQATGRRDLDARTDVYALGALLYHALTDRPPFGGNSDLETAMNVVNKELVPPSQYNLAIPRELELICLKALQKDRRRRYPTAAAFQRDLESWLAGQPVTARPISLATRTVERLRRNIAIVATVAIATIAVAGVTTYAILSVRESRRALEDLRTRQNRDERESDRSQQEREERESDARRILAKAQEADSAEERIELATRALRAWPEFGEAYLVRGLAQRDRERAMEDLRNAVRYSPSSPGPALLARADLALELGRTKDAIADLRGALQRQPNLPGARLKLATACVCDGDPGGALGALDGADENPEMLAVRSFARALAGRFDEALADAERSANEAARLHALALQGEAALREGDIARVAGAFMATLGAKTDLSATLAGVTRTAVARFTSAVNEAERERPELRRAVSTALAEAALARIMKNDVAGGRPLLEIAMTRDPGNALPVAGMGLIYVAEMRFDEVIVWGEKALKLDPTCLEGRFVRGLAHGAKVLPALQAGQLAEPRDGVDPPWMVHYLASVEDIQEFTSHSSRWPEYRQMFAALLKMNEAFLNRMKTSAPIAQHVARRFLGLAKGRLDAGDAPCAKELYTQSIFLDRGAAAYAGRARAHLALKQWNEALQDVAKAVEIDPSLAEELKPVESEARRNQ